MSNRKQAGTADVPSAQNTSLNPSPHRGWHSRGYLPHFDSPGLVQSLTIRLFDSLPETARESLKLEMRLLPPEQQKIQRIRRIEAFLDAGYGSCFLRNPEVAQRVEDALLFFDRKRYQLLRWTLMPNHAHALVETLAGFALDGVVQSWKSYTAKQANKILGRTGRFWMPDYFDRYIRDRDHFENVLRYIDENPVRAGLVKKPQDWKFSTLGWEVRQRGGVV